MSQCIFLTLGIALIYCDLVSLFAQESSKAEDALFRLGFSDEDCWGSYDEEDEKEYGEEL